MDYPTPYMPASITQLVNQYLNEHQLPPLSALPDEQQAALQLFLKNAINQTPSLKNQLIDPMIKACQAGDGQAVHYLISLGVDINQSFSLRDTTFTETSRLFDNYRYEKTEATYETFLTIATRAGHIEVVDSLLKAGAKPNCKNEFSIDEIYVDPLGICQSQAIPHRFEIISLLLQYGAPVADLTSFSGYTYPLDFAVDHHQPQLVEQLRKMGETRVAYNKWDKLVTLGLVQNKKYDKYEAIANYYFELPPLQTQVAPSSPLPAPPPSPSVSPINQPIAEISPSKKILNANFVPPVVEASSLFQDVKLNTRIQNQEILTLGWYFAYGIDSSKERQRFNRDPLSKHTMNFKNDYLAITKEVEKNPKNKWKQTSIEQSFHYYLALLNPLISPGAILAVVPSSNPHKEWHGITRFLKLCVKKLGLIDGANLLVRTHEIQKLAGNAFADRSEEVHQASLAIGHPEDVVGKTILLIDDVTSTGNSLKVAIEKFQAAGAHKIVCLVFGKTAPGHAFVAHQLENPEPSPINPSAGQKRLNKLIRHNAAIQANQRNFDTLVQEAQDVKQAYGYSFKTALPRTSLYAGSSQATSPQAVNNNNNNNNRSPNSDKTPGQKF